jgi:large subunit ribosomal protein L24
MMTAEKSKLSIRKSDQVQVIAGREKGKIGKVLHVDRVKSKITVEKINLVKRHMRPNQKNPHGGIVEKETPLHYSNVLLMCGKCNRGVRHGFKVVEKKASKSAKGEKSSVQAKVRVCKRCGGTLETA